MPKGTIAAIAAVLILLGGMLAHFTQTTNGIRVEDVRFKGAAGNTMSALIYIPRNASERSPAPGISGWPAVGLASAAAWRLD
jgi:hypothetical protein